MNFITKNLSVWEIILDVYKSWTELVMASFWDEDEDEFNGGHGRFNPVGRKNRDDEIVGDFDSEID